MRDCHDCRYAHPTGEAGEYKCQKTGRRFNYYKQDTPACSYFINESDSSRSCYECDYFADTFLGGHICKRTGKKILEDDKACGYFRD